MINLINLTPHAINLQGVGSIPASGLVIRVETTERILGAVNGLPLIKTVLGGVTGIPDPSENTLYIVSAFVAQASNRQDLICPDTGNSCIRENGNIVAITQFTKY